MNWRRFALVATGWLAIVLWASAGDAVAQAPFTTAELTTPPYHLSDGPRGMVERADRRERLAAAALASGDHARAARHLAKACYALSEMTIDLALRAPACQRARALARDHGIVDVEVSLMTTEGNLRAWSLDVTGAVARLQAAIGRGAGLNPALPDSAPLNDAHFALGAILIEAGQFEVARRELTFALDNCAKAGNPTCVGFAQTWLCRLHTQLGDFGAARTACDAAQASADGDVFVLMNLGWMRANLEAALQRHDASLAALQAAWQTAQVRGGELLWPTLMHSIADTLVTLGRLDEADVWQRRLEEATASGFFPASYNPQTAMRRGQLAMARGRIDDAVMAFTVAAGSPMHEMSISADYALAAARRAQANLPGAREALERAVAKIEAGRTNLSGPVLRSSYLNLHATAYRELVGVRWDAEGNAAAAQALAIAETGRARALLDSLKSAQVAGAAAPTLDATAVQATLGPNDVLVEYVSSRDRLFAITVTRNSISIALLPGAGAAVDLARRVDFFSALVQESNEAALAATARRLYADVLAPALANVPATARTLIIAADGPLHRLPFDALNDRAPLIERWDIVTVPSASALASRVRRALPTRAALVVTAPATAAGLDPLPAAPAEAAAIRRRVGGQVDELLGADASESRLTSSGLDQFAVVHFASHAVVDETTPLRSALVLASSSPEVDGQWNADEIYRTQINADLVVLSACSTAAGAPAPGEGVMSLSRAFLYAGAGATVATLWDVPDAPGPIFADVLYRELAAGKPLGAATANARRELRRRGAPPRAWAAYVLTGNPGATVGITARTDPWAWSARIAAGLAAALWLVTLIVFITRTRASIRWPAPATAAVALAIIAAVLAQWPTWALRMDFSVDRGASAGAIEALVSNGRLVWMPVPAADEHTVEVFDAAGVAVGPATTAASPFAIPVATAGGWIRVEARQQGQLVGRSPLVRLNARQ